MDVIIIFNGLGNQMSQYALYLAKSLAGQKVDYLCYDSGHNGIELQRLFGIDTTTSFRRLWLKKCLSILFTKRTETIVLTLRKLLHFCGAQLYDENFDYRCHQTVLTERKGLRFLVGGWHHPEYFEHIRQELLRKFQFPQFTDTRNIEIATCDKQHTVAIHIRKGDYMDAHNYERYGAVCTDIYYKNAIEAVENVIDNPHFYIFSNDKAWAEKIIGSRNATFVDWNTKENSWEDMALMSTFENIIIANSTFSWWAAWLGDPTNKKIYRPPFFVNNDPQSDIYPSHWIVIDNK